MTQTISVLIFVFVIVAIVSEKIHRTAAASAGAVALLLFHILDIKKSVSYIDFNTIGVLVGMMVFVAVIKCSGLFEYISIKTAKIAKGNPWKIMFMFTIVTAVLSAFLDNVTTVLLIGPMIISITGILKLNPVPFLLIQIMASNIGGTATLIGDPPNIMIGSAAKFEFLDFLRNTGPAVIIIMMALILMAKVMYGDKMKAGEDAIKEVMALDEKKAIVDVALLAKSIIMIFAVIGGFMFHSLINVESSVVSLAAAVIMLIIGKQNVEDIIEDVEWPTIIFFMALFVVVGGMVETGVIDKLAKIILSLTSGHAILTMVVLLWSSALLSSILDNIPFVATLIPLIMAMSEAGVNVTPFWWAISLGACLGGNGTLIGASANVVLCGISGRYGHPITFTQFLKVGLPVMIVSIMISTVYLLIRYSV